MLRRTRNVRELEAAARTVVAAEPRIRALQRRAAAVVLLHVAGAIGTLGIGWWLLGLVVEQQARPDGSLGPGAWIAGALVVAPIVACAGMIVWVSGPRQAVLLARSVRAAASGLAVEAPDIGPARDDSLRRLARMCSAWTLLRMLIVGAQVAERSHRDTSAVVALPIHGVGIVTGMAGPQTAALVACAALDERTRGVSSTAEESTAGGELAVAWDVFRATGASDGSFAIIGAFARAREGLACFVVFLAASACTAWAAFSLIDSVPLSLVTPVLLLGVLGPVAITWVEARARCSTIEVVCAVAAYHARVVGACPAAFSKTTFGRVQPAVPRAAARAAADAA